MECLFHEKRTTFDDLINDIKILKWIPRQYAHRIAMAICSCRRSKGELTDIETFHNQSEDLCKSFVNDEIKELPLTGALEKYLDLCRNQQKEPDYCTHRLVSILYNAKCGCFSMLQRENVSSNKTDVGVIKPKHTGKQRLTQKQIECMVRKRKRKYESQIMKVDMFPGNTKKLDEKLNQERDNPLLSMKDSKKWVMEYYPHILNNRNFENKVKETHIKLWAKDLRSLKDIKSFIQSKAVAVQTKEDERWRQRRQWSYSRVDFNINASTKENEVLQSKEQLSADFEKRFYKLTQEKAQFKKSPCNPVLEGGHCLQCLKLFTGLKDTSPCTFHPGFIDTNGLWSCCPDMLDETPEMDYDCHSMTGCKTSATHVWRPHARRSRGVGKKELYIEHQYARSRHIKHQYEKHKKRHN